MGTAVLLSGAITVFGHHGTQSLKVAQNRDQGICEKYRQEGRREVGREMMEGSLIPTDIHSSVG